jgi:hypothetical protein
VSGGGIYGTFITFCIGQGNGGALTTPEQFLIYDCWITATFADGTGTTFRPAAASIKNDGPFDVGTITNPQNAIDGDPTTYALIERDFLDTLDFSPELVLGNFR